MDKDINKRIAEVIDILNHTDEKLVNKISKSFLEFLNKNKSEDYKVNINYEDEKWKENLNEKTKAILFLIYRDYFADEEEREKIIREEKEELKKLEEERKEKYNPDNLFKKHVNSVIEEDDVTKDLVVITNVPWYKRLFEKIKSIFGNKKI